MISSITNKLDDNAPAIFTGLGVVSLCTTAIASCYGTVKAVERLKKREEPCKNKREVVATIWSCYIWTGLSIAVGAYSIVNANKLNTVRYATLLSTLECANRTQEKIFGDESVYIPSMQEKKNEQEKHGKKPSEGNAILEDDKILVYETYSNTWFETTTAELHVAELNLNQRFTNDGLETLASFYDELGIEHDADMYDVGWNCSDMEGEHVFIPIRHNSAISASGKPCLVIEFLNKPRENYTEDILGGY